jgi:hypothetical protein
MQHRQQQATLTTVLYHQHNHHHRHQLPQRRLVANVMCDTRRETVMVTAAV